MVSDLVCNQFAHEVLIQKQYRTHTSSAAELLHTISEWMVWPAHSLLHLLAYGIQPNPGENKDVFFRAMVIRFGVISGLLFINFALRISPYFRMTSLIFGMVLPIAGYLLRAIDSRWRPLACYLIHDPDKTPEQPAMNIEQPLHIRSHNLALVPRIIGILTDLRDPVRRAKELIKSIANDSNKPDICFFQEAALLNEDATRVFVKGLQPTYPYIIYNVAKNNVIGFSSGAMVASRYPIKFDGFYPFRYMVTTEKSAPRGILLVSVDTQQGKLMIANVHTQSLLGEKRSRARYLQISELYQIIKQRCHEEGCYGIVLGDFNTSRITAWGEDNLEPKNQAERSVLECLAEKFEDPFLKDHGPITGLRTHDKPIFRDTGEEPTGTWYHGPFATRGLIMKLTDWLDRWLNGRDAPKQKFFYGKPTWGTANWNPITAVATARFDMILFPKNIGRQKPPLKADVQIRRIDCPLDSQSASSDHLPVDANLYVN